MTTWKIEQLERKTSNGFVFAVHWSANAKDGGVSARTYGACYWDDGVPVIAYENLTEEEVLQWVWEKIKKTEIESNLNQQIESQKTPETLSGIPWEAK